MSKLHLEEYKSIESVLGSDHRPVSLKLTIDVYLDHLMEPFNLTNHTTPKQGKGTITLKNIDLFLSST